MRHDSPQGERIGFWAHVGFAAAYLLAFAWHCKGAREHYRDMQPKQWSNMWKDSSKLYQPSRPMTNLPDLKMDVKSARAILSSDSPFLRLKNETPFEHIDRNPGQELYDRTLHDHERLPNRTWAEYNVHYTTLEDLIEEDRMASLHARRVDKDF